MDLNTVILLGHLNPDGDAAGSVMGLAHYYILDPVKLKRTVDCEAKPTAADYIYMGILHDTGCFTRAKVSTMQAVTELLKMGVDHSYVMQTMHKDTLGSLQRARQRESVMRISIQSVDSLETAKTFSLVLPCIRKKKIAGVVPSGQDK